MKRRLTETSDAARALIYEPQAQLEEAVSRLEALQADIENNGCLDEEAKKLIQRLQGQLVSFDDLICGICHGEIGDDDQPYVNLKCDGTGETGHLFHVGCIARYLL